jgi:hypothetical protein
MKCSRSAAGNPSSSSLDPWGGWACKEPWGSRPYSSFLDLETSWNSMNATHCHTILGVYMGASSWNDMDWNFGWLIICAPVCFGRVGAFSLELGIVIWYLAKTCKIRGVASAIPRAFWLHSSMHSLPPVAYPPSAMQVLCVQALIYATVVLCFILLRRLSQAKLSHPFTLKSFTLNSWLVQVFYGLSLILSYLQGLLLSSPCSFQFPSNSMLFT